MLERLMICKSGQPTLNGSKSSHTEENTSVISNKPTNVSMLLEISIRKDNKSKLTIDITVLTRDGRFFILIRRQRLRLRD